MVFFQSPLRAFVLLSLLTTGLSFVTNTGRSSHPTLSNPIQNDALFMSTSPPTTEVPDWATRLLEESKEIAACANLVLSAVLLPKEQVEAEDIVKLCDEIDATPSDTLRFKVLESRRYEYLANLMQKDYDAYIATASFLSPSRIARRQLPNLQDVPIDKNAVPKNYEVKEDGSVPLVDDCELEDMKYNESILDKVLLSIFRKLVTENTNGNRRSLGAGENLHASTRTNSGSPTQDGLRYTCRIDDTRASSLLSYFHVRNRSQRWKQVGWKADWALVLCALVDHNSNAHIFRIFGRSLLSQSAQGRTTGRSGGRKVQISPREWMQGLVLAPMQTSRPTILCGRPRSATDGQPEL